MIRLIGMVQFRCNMQGQPIYIMQQGTTQEKGRTAQTNNIAAAKAVAQAVRTTLGPMGMDKMLVDEGGDVIITNDGATILSEIDIEHPTAKMIIGIAKTQEQECYDGTTSAVIVAGELLKRCEGLIEQNVHPTTICRGLRKGLIFLMGELNAYEIADFDLMQIARTALTGKSADSFKDVIGDICVKAVQNTSSLEEIRITKALGGSAGDSEIINGIIIDKERCHPAMPTLLNHPFIALIDANLGVKQTEIEANIQITDPAQMESFLAKEEAELEKMAFAFDEVGANIVLCQREIDDLVKYHFAKLGILALEKVTMTDMEAVAAASGSAIVNNIKDLASNPLGTFNKAEQITIGEMPLLRLDEGNSDAVTVLLRGPTTHFVEEIERAFDDASGVVSVAIKDGKILAGGGSVYAGLSHALTVHASNIGGREGMAMGIMGDALESIPRTLAENAGLDPVDEMMNLNKAHASGDMYHGINIEVGGTIDMRELGVFEPKRVVEQALKSAVETAIMVLRIDDIISSKKGQPQG